MINQNINSTRLFEHNKRVLRRPDLRNVLSQRLSGEKVSPKEIDYDELVIQRSWRSFESEKPDEVRYFMFELTQKNPGEKLFAPPFYKAVRMIRLTRVPRYLRLGNGGPDLVFEQMRDVLAALREQGTLFINLIAKSPELPLVFAYGVQGIGDTVEEAQKKADEAFAVLDFQLSGTYQQLMYKPISINEGEVISRYQSEWSHLAMARGRPLPSGNSLGTATILDGNRTDIESTNNQLESFIRGMSDKSFLLSLVTVPLSPAEISFSWRNLTQKLSEVKSEISGSRSVNAGVAFPLVMGSSDGNNSGSTHTSGSNQGTSNSNADSFTSGKNFTSTEGINNSFTLGANQSHTSGTNESTTDGTSVTNTEGVSRSTSTTTGTNTSHGVTHTTGVSDSVAKTTGESQSVSKSYGDNWSTSSSQSVSSTVTNSTGTSQSQGTNNSQTISSTSTQGQTATTGSDSTSGSNVSGGVLGTGGGTTSSSGTSSSNSVSSQTATGVSQTNGNSSTVGSNSSVSNSQTTGSTITDSIGGSTSTTNTTGTNSSTTNTTGTNSSTSISDTTGTSRSTTEGVTTSKSTSIGSSHAVTKGTSLSDSTGTSSSNSIGSSSANAKGTSSSVGNTRTDGTNQGVSDAWALAYSRSYASSGSLAVAPNFGVSISRNTFDAAKSSIADMLDAQLRRYNEGLKSGAFLYQMFLVCPDRETLVGGAGLLKSAFWGAGQSNDHLPQPFHTITNFTTEERNRLLIHANAFTSYRRREEVVELIEPFKYSSYLTPTEGAAFVHPPVVEGPGLLAVHDSMPVLRMPTDRQNSEIHLGHVVNGERGIVSDIKFGVSIDDLKGHALIAGVTGSGKTTTLMKLLSDAVKVERVIIEQPTISRPYPVEKVVRPSILALDWMRNMRNLASIPELVNSGRFKFYSVLKPELGRFKWNPLQVPDNSMSTAEWLSAQADNFTASFNLGEFGRSLITEFLTDLYGANRLNDFILRNDVVDKHGQVIRKKIVLKAIPENQIPLKFIQKDLDGNKFVNAFTYPELSRCLSLSHLAIYVAAKIEEGGNPDVVRISGTQTKERLQSLWRRLQYFVPGGQYDNMLTYDEDLSTKNCLTVTDLINPETGVVSVIETDGLDFSSRRLILGSVLLAVYRFGLHHGDGVFDYNGKGPGCLIVMEESHELFGNPSAGEDTFSAETRTALYEGMFRRVRALGLRLIPVAQQPSSLPEAVTANVNTVFIHKVRAKSDREKVFSLLNWSNNIGQQMREYRYLGEIPTGYCIARIDANEDYTESAPIQFKTELPLLEPVSDQFLRQLPR